MPKKSSGKGIKASFAVTGFEDIDRMLEQLKPSNQRSIIGRIMKKNMKPVLNSIKAALPKGKGAPDGSHLATNLKIYPGPRSSSTVWYNVGPDPKLASKDVGNEKKRARRERLIRSGRGALNALYKWVEFGAVDENGNWITKPTRAWAKTHAQYDGAFASSFRSDFEREYQKEIDRLAKRAAKGGK